MKLQRLLFTFLLYLICWQFGFGQEKPQAGLIDEFGELTCDDLLTRLNYFSEELVKEKNARTYIVIYGNKNYPMRKYRQEVTLFKYWEFLRFPNNLNVLHASDEEKTKTQIWLVPENADKPDIKEGSWDYVLPETTKPFIFYKESWISEGCAETFSFEFYSKFLLADSNISGNLVIFEKNSQRFQKTKSQLFKDLVQKYKIPIRQIKTFHIKSNKSDVEYWLVPQKKK